MSIIFDDNELEAVKHLLKEVGIEESDETVDKVLAAVEKAFEEEFDEQADYAIGDLVADQ